VYKEEKDQKTVPAKSATLEVTPAQAELTTKAAAIGQLSLALRPLDSADADANAEGAGRVTNASRQAGISALSDSFGGDKPSGPVVIRYGVAARVAVQGNAGEAQQNVRKWAQ
jgi:Flp pilus assembly protein CpaB